MVRGVVVWGGKEVKPEKTNMDTSRLIPLAIFTKSPFGDYFVSDHGLQSTEVDFGTLARDFSHRALICDYEMAYTNFRGTHPSS